MKRLIQIEKFLSGEKSTLYSIRFIDSNGVPEKLNETQKFFGKIKSEYPKDYQIFKALFKNILTISGARENFFRYEGNADCEFLKALIKYNSSKSKYKGNFRLFCLFYNKDRVILGNGGFKNTRTFNEDENLNKIARVLQNVDKVLSELEKDGEVSWNEQALISKNDLIFEIEV